MKTLILLMAAAALTAASCQRKGTMERAGERADEIVDNVAEGENPLKRKGPMERAGEAVDEAIPD